jgi:hypothetical protein
VVRDECNRAGAHERQHALTGRTVPVAGGTRLRRRSAAGPSVSAFSRPFEPFHDTYQAFYWEGLRRHCREIGGEFAVLPMTRFPQLLRTLRSIQDGGPLSRVFGRRPGPRALIETVGRRLEGDVSSPSPYFHNGAAQYLVTTTRGARHRLCIDSTDYPECSSEPLVDWSDLYFKSNFWSSRTYHPNVQPIVNGDPLVLRRLASLRAHRGTLKDFDFSFAVRVWGGRTGLEGVDHNLQLLRAISRVRGRKFILAVLVTGDVDRYANYLDNLRIPWTKKGIRARELWSITARSRLNILRLGMHYCIPWRFTGALAIGSCIVMDRSPLSVWPEPLREGINYLSLETGVGPDEPVASAETYDEVPTKVESWLADEPLLAEIRAQNAKYFDLYADPKQVGAYVLARVEALERTGTIGAATRNSL